METKKNVFTNPVVILLLSIFVTALWGSATPAIKVGYELFHIATEDIPTKMLFAGVRFFSAGLMVGAAGLVTKRNMLPKKKDWLPITGLGFLQTTTNYIFFYIGLGYTTGAKGSLFSSIGAFFVVLLAPIFYREERITVKKLIGCIVGFIGLYLVTTGGDAGALSGFHFMGEGFVIIGALCGTFGSLYTKHLSKDHDSIFLTGWQLTIGGALLIMIGLLTGGHLEFTSVTAVILLSYMALLSALAFGIQTQMIRYNPVSKITFYNLLIPIFGTSLSGIFLHENVLTWTNLLALLLVCGGIGIVNHQKHQTAVRS